MRTIFATLILVLIASLADASDFKPVKLPAEVATGVVRGDHYFAITADGRLIDLDLKGHKVKDLGNFERKFLPMLDVAGERAIVASPVKGAKDETRTQISLIDLKTGKIEKSLEQATKTKELGFLTANRFFIDNGKQEVEIRDVGKDEPIQKINLNQQATEKKPEGGRLYIRNSGNGLLVVDLEKGKVIRRIPLGDGKIPFARAVCQIGDEIIVTGYKNYLKDEYRMFRVDIATGKVTQIKPPEQSYVILEGPDRTLLVCGEKAIYQCDASGKMISKTPLEKPARLLGVCQGQLLLADKSEIQIVALEKAKNEAEDRAVAAIEKLGGKVERDKNKPGSPVVSVNLSSLKVTNKDLEHLKELHALESLDLSLNPITDGGLMHLKDMKRLRSLQLAFTNITGAGLEHLEGLSQLENLHVGYCKVRGGEGMKKLQKALPKLKIIGP